jgi:hypothetical protein
MANRDERIRALEQRLKGQIQEWAKQNPGWQPDEAMTALTTVFGLGVARVVMMQELSEARGDAIVDLVKKVWRTFLVEHMGTPPSELILPHGVRPS